MKIYWKVKTLYCYLHDNYKYSQLKLNRIKKLRQIATY